MPIKISKKEIALILTFYLVMSVLHYLTLIIDLNRQLPFFGIALNYSIKAILTLPLLWLYFKKMSTYDIWKKATLHLLTISLFTYLWILSYQSICDSLSIYRLHGARQVWDIYLTILFYGIQFGAYHIYDYARQLKEEQLLSAELGRLNAQSELTALKAQLNPHFLYNVFNTINAAIPETAKNARNMIHELSDLFRYQLKASSEEMVPLKEELNFVVKYLDLEKERFGSRLQYEINVTTESADTLIPPLIIQPLVENCIKHGISPLIEGGKIIIGVSKQIDHLKVSVCDSGVGTKGHDKSLLLKKGIGLSNTHSRLMKMYKKGITLNENLPQGLCVSFTIPTTDQPIQQ